MTAKRLRLIPAIVPLLFLISCGSEQSAPQQQQQSYKDTKSMVIDVLKTEDAQKALEEASAKSKNKSLQMLATGEGQQIQLAVRDLLTTQDHGVKMLEATMKDPKFAGDFAKAAQGSLKQMEKDLIKDPEYQKSLIEAFNNPDFQQLLLQTMKSQKYRQQMKEVVLESLKSPLYKAELISMFEKAVEMEMKKQDKTLTISQEGGAGGGGGGGDKKKGGGDGGDGGGGSEGGGEEKSSDSGEGDGGDQDSSGEEGGGEKESKEKKK